MINHIDSMCCHFDMQGFSASLRNILTDNTHRIIHRSDICSMADPNV
jgi:hypothetical protein